MDMDRCRQWRPKAEDLEVVRAMNSLRIDKKHPEEIKMGELGNRFTFKKGDHVRWKVYRNLRGIIKEDVQSRGNERLPSWEKSDISYLVKLSNGAVFKAAPAEIEPI
jgi:hypothetical protein